MELDLPTSAKKQTTEKHSSLFYNTGFWNCGEKQARVFFQAIPLEYLDLY